MRYEPPTGRLSPPPWPVGLSGCGEDSTPFASEEDAQAFAKQYGGTGLRFDQITPDRVILDGGVLRDERM